MHLAAPSEATHTEFISSRVAILVLCWTVIEWEWGLRRSTITLLLLGLTTGLATNAEQLLTCLTSSNQVPPSIECCVLARISISLLGGMHILLVSCTVTCSGPSCCCPTDMDTPDFASCRHPFTKLMVQPFCCRKSRPTVLSDTKESMISALCFSTVPSSSESTRVDPRTARGVPSTPTSRCSIHGSSICDSFVPWSHTSPCTRVTGEPVSISREIAG